MLSTSHFSVVHVRYSRGFHKTSVGDRCDTKSAWVVKANEKFVRYVGRGPTGVGRFRAGEDKKSVDLWDPGKSRCASSSVSLFDGGGGGGDVGISVRPSARRDLDPCACLTILKKKKTFGVCACAYKIYVKRRRVWSRVTGVIIIIRSYWIVLYAEATFTRTTRRMVVGRAPPPPHGPRRDATVDLVSARGSIAGRLAPGDATARSHPCKRASVDVYTTSPLGPDPPRSCRLVTGCRPRGKSLRPVRFAVRSDNARVSPPPLRVRSATVGPRRFHVYFLSKTHHSKSRRVTYYCFTLILALIVGFISQIREDPTQLGMCARPRKS